MESKTTKEKLKERYNHRSLCEEGVNLLEKVRDATAELWEFHDFDGAEAGIYCCYPDRLNPSCFDECQEYLEERQRDQFDIVREKITDGIKYTADFEKLIFKDWSDIGKDSLEYFQNFLKELNDKFIDLEIKVETIENETFFDEYFTNSLEDVWNWMNYLMTDQCLDLEEVFDFSDSLWNSFKKKLEAGKHLHHQNANAIMLEALPDES